MKILGITFLAKVTKAFQIYAIIHQEIEVGLLVHLYHHWTTLIKQIQIYLLRPQYRVNLIQPILIKNTSLASPKLYPAFHFIYPIT